MSSNFPFASDDPGLVDPGLGEALAGADAGTDPTMMDGQPSPDQMRAYLAQLRAAPVSAVIAQVMQVLLDAAQVKQGRKDSRLVLDLVALIRDQARPHLDAELVAQLDEAVPQLQLAQVEAESQIKQARAAGQYSPDDDPNDLERYDGLTDAPPPAAPAPPSAASRLWTPGMPGAPGV